MGLRFQWNPQKAETNFKKHGISFAEAATVFGDPLAGIKDDPAHSNTEDRYIIVGMSQKFQILVVAFTERKEMIRIINARRATRKERQQYEEKFHR